MHTARSTKEWSGRNLQRASEVKNRAAAVFRPLPGAKKCPELRSIPVAGPGIQRKRHAPRLHRKAAHARSQKGIRIERPGGRSKRESHPHNDVVGRASGQSHTRNNTEALHPIGFAVAGLRASHTLPEQKGDLASHGAPASTDQPEVRPDSQTTPARRFNSVHPPTNP
jgi:hypothetical protein